MVATILRLKLTLLVNGWRRSTAMRLGLAVGVVAATVVVSLVVATLWESRADPEELRLLVVLGGALLLVGWAALPVTFYGVDPTIEAGRFATYAVPTRQLAFALILAGPIGVPGVATVAVTTASLGVSASRVLLLPIAALAAAVAVFTAVLMSRVTVSAASALLQTRRWRDTALVIGSLGLIVVIGAVASASDALDRSLAESVLDVVGWSPVGAVWGVPSDVVAGEAWAALAHTAIALAFLGVLAVLWERQVDAMVHDPRQVGRSASVPPGRDGLGHLGRLRNSAGGAIAARGLTQWTSDPRFLVQAVLIVLLPVGLLVHGFHGHPGALLAAPVSSAYILGWVQHNDIGFDGTAFWMHVGARVRGRSDRLGRLAPPVVLAAVCVPAYTVAAGIGGAAWGQLPAIFGGAVAVLLCGLAVASVASAIRQAAVPAVGDNPFGSRPGQGSMHLLFQLACGTGVVLMAFPALVVMLVGLLGPAWTAWAALVVAPLAALPGFLVAVAWGARLFDRRAPLLLERLVAVR